ncbi:uncharacterized protein LOC131151825 isoform X2 [Malania oleifera]|uniref:uncharacterized protein LOC131151825 isoform X2 n=1 Tax=Malania oleifera TaxID=397392 RepID=UPI0025AECDC8|nr:uncharacterized protein LOC131151825 isoform X2 [Malania oleifera]
MSAFQTVSRLFSRFPYVAHKLNSKSIGPATCSLKTNSQSLLPPSAKRLYQISRLPVELSCMLSMMPLHSAIASARLRSFLSVESQSWSLITQGIAMPL